MNALIGIPVQQGMPQKLVLRVHTELAQNSLTTNNSQRHTIRARRPREGHWAKRAGRRASERKELGRARRSKAGPLEVGRPTCVVYADVRAPLFFFFILRYERCSSCSMHARARYSASIEMYGDGCWRVPVCIRDVDYYYFSEAALLFLCSFVFCFCFFFNPWIIDGPWVSVTIILML